MTETATIFEAAPDAQPAVPAGGMPAFLVIGAGAACGFVLLSAVLIPAVPVWPAWLVSSLCYAGFIVPVYLLQRRFVFGKEAPHAAAFPRYVAVQAGAVALATGFSFLAHAHLALSPLFAATAIAGLTAVANFFVLRLWAFATR